MCLNDRIISIFFIYFSAKRGVYDRYTTSLKPSTSLAPEKRKEMNVENIFRSTISDDIGKS